MISSELRRCFVFCALLMFLLLPRHGDAAQLSDASAASDSVM